ncbi:MBL fold metallo-hydrolase [Candidatus Cyanaurora vandensis]|uniref:MBL fold metallo-hydrolase n=1 Tax=Candidatus Cyanaurora vandensis TaxID=2714958 RepID=UPI002580D4C3|nr:MBL fold metallo-hydrolase [Candidatus Cyanaurora vandensis]
MQRRNFLLAGASLLSAPVLAQSPKSTLTIRWLGHTSFLFTSGEMRILVNPFRPLACTKGYQKPAVDTDLVLMSSRLFDEGAIEVVPGNPKVLYQPGVYEVESFKLQGIRTLHDTREGRRFGVNVVWRWVQGGITLVHLGGLAVPLTDDQKILIGQPDILFVPVGGGMKAMDGAQAVETVKALNPKIVVPTHYRTPAADAQCDLAAPEAFLSAFPKENLKVYPGTEISLSPNQIPKTALHVRLFTYTNFNLGTRVT